MIDGMGEEKGGLNRVKTNNGRMPTLKDISISPASPERKREKGGGSSDSLQRMISTENL